MLYIFPTCSSPPLRSPFWIVVVRSFWCLRVLDLWHGVFCVDDGCISSRFCLFPIPVDILEGVAGIAKSKFENWKVRNHHWNDILPHFVGRVDCHGFAGKLFSIYSQLRACSVSYSTSGVFFGEIPTEKTIETISICRDSKIIIGSICNSCFSVLSRA